MLTTCDGSGDGPAFLPTASLLPAHNANCPHRGTANVPSNQRLKCEHPTDEHYVLSFTDENSFD